MVSDYRWLTLYTCKSLDGIMYVFIYVCMYGCMDVLGMFGCLYVCVYLSMNVCMYACMHVLAKKTFTFTVSLNGTINTVVRCVQRNG